MSTCPEYEGVICMILKIQYESKMTQYYLLSVEYIDKNSTSYKIGLF